MIWVNAVVQGLLLGSLYAMFAIGLSLMFGVMRMVNVAHGDFIVLAGFGGLFAVATWHVNPFVAMFGVVPVAFALGYALQRYLLNRILRADPLPSLVVTFGISIIIQNLLLQFFHADTRSIAAGGLEGQSLALMPGLDIGVLPVIIFALGVVITAGFQWLFGHTLIGRAFRAVSDDGETAVLMGINREVVYALATGLAIGVVGVAGVLQAMRTTISPTDGPAQLIYAFEAVIIGGMGSFWGTFAGGLLLGVAQGVGFQANPGWGILVGHLAFLATLVLRPTGLFPKTVG